MSASQFGHLFSIMSFGESHGRGLGVVIDGCPAGVVFDEGLMGHNLERRRPGQHGNKKAVVSNREEGDRPEILSGVFEGITLGTPIAVMVYNENQRSKDYKEIKNSPRPGHADDVWKLKFGHSDYRGGGRSSGRETLSRVIGGSVAQMLLKEGSPATRVVGFCTQVGPIQLTDAEKESFVVKAQAGDTPESFTGLLPNEEKSNELEKLLLEAKAKGRSYGGVAEILIFNPPSGLGQPVFHKLKAELCSAFLGVGATSGVELGEGFGATKKEGATWHGDADQSKYGGIRGGISTGETIRIRVAFKPTATVLHAATSGRHDPCIIPRAIPVLEAMSYLVLADHWLWCRNDKLK